METVSTEMIKGYFAVAAALITGIVALVATILQGRNQRKLQASQEMLELKLRENDNKNAAVLNTKQLEMQQDLHDSRQRFDKELENDRNQHQKALEASRDALQRQLNESKQRFEKELLDTQFNFQQRLQQSQSLLQAQIEDASAEKDALRDYKYEAHKRLYHELYPMLFQTSELADSALRRIGNMARESQSSAWLKDDRDTYYMDSTIYRLFAPLAMFRLIQNQLTHFDLSLDKRTHSIYNLLKLAQRSFSDDFQFSRIINMDPAYEPHWTNISKLPDNQYPQGLVKGDLECITESFIRENGSGKSRCITFSEFSKLCGDNDFRKSIKPARELFQFFSPNQRPLLWYILTLQYGVYSQIARSATLGDDHIKMTGFDESVAKLLDSVHDQLPYKPTEVVMKHLQSLSAAQSLA